MAETTKTGARAGGRKQATAKPKEEAQTPPHVCSVAFCPIGMALSAAQGAGPDVLEHLLAAAREFLLAAKAVVDARGADFEEKEDTHATLKRIEIG
jgi:hypothetical protein